MYIHHKCTPVSLWDKDWRKECVKFAMSYYFQLLLSYIKLLIMYTCECDTLRSISVPEPNCGSSWIGHSVLTPSFLQAVLPQVHGNPVVHATHKLWYELIMYCVNSMR